jgi:maleylpyruvate isomerase
MDAAQRRLSDELDAATQRLIDDARIIPGPGLRQPSLLPGWSRAHVLAHLARNADAMRNVLIGARAGQERPGYPSAEAREADIEQGAGADAQVLVTGLADSAVALRTVMRQLPDEAWRFPVRMRDPARFPASELLVRRLAEVELHHCDLGIGYGPSQWSGVYAGMELAEPMRSQRADRLSFVQPESVRAASKARKTPPYRPGQPLPGMGRAPGRR